jgi:hypothetical protein
VQPNFKSADAGSIPVAPSMYDMHLRRGYN